MRTTIPSCALLILAAPVAAAPVPATPAQDAPDAGAADEDLEDPLPALPEAGDVMMLRLRDGTIRWGAIVDHSPDGFRFQLLTHGGLAEVPWSRLDPAQEEELRTRYGYVDVSTDELFVDVERLMLVDGREVDGVILSREGENFVVKVDGNLQLIPKRRVQGIATGHRLPALDVYSREELYGRFAAEADPEDFESQLELARRCEQILDFVHAVEHYELASTLEGGDGPEVQFALDRARAKADQQVQIDYLRDVDLDRKRGRFDEALGKLEAFHELYPESPLLQDVAEARERVLIGRDEALREFVARRWGYWAQRLSRSEASELDFPAAVEYATEGLGLEVREKVLEDVQERISPTVTEEEVEAYFATRKRLRYKTASYGFGTWLLGEERARAGIEEEEQNRGELSEKEAERAELDEKIQRFLESQRAQRRARGQKEMAEEHATFWAHYPPSSRATWIRAYYVEFGGDYEIRSRPTLRPCSSCAGSGVHEVLSIGGGPAPRESSGRRSGSSRGGSGGVHLVSCSACRGSAILRRIYYR